MFDVTLQIMKPLHLDQVKLFKTNLYQMFIKSDVGVVNDFYGLDFVQIIICHKSLLSSKVS